MGYFTDYKGELKFTQPLTDAQIADLNTMLGEFCPDHPEWNVPHIRSIDLKFTKDGSGLTWNGAEKTADLNQVVEFVLDVMHTEYPDFGLTGKILAQGEDINDRWQLYLEAGAVKTRDLAIEGKEIECPHCHKMFIYDP